jgi:Bacteriophage CI repressor helix-turn-helix domain
MSPDEQFVDLALAALKRHLKVNRDDELSEALGVAKSTVASWRRRVQIPKEIAARAESEFGINFVALANAVGLEHRLKVGLLRDAFYVAVFKIVQMLGTDDEAVQEFAVWVSNSEVRICRTLGIGESVAESQLSLVEARLLFQSLCETTPSIVESLWQTWQDNPLYDKGGK